MANGRALPVNTDVTAFTANTYPDDTGYVRVVAEGRGNEWEKISFLTLFANGGTARLFAPRAAPYIIDAATWGDVAWGIGAGTVYFDIANLAFQRRYSFYANSTTTVYLDPGRSGIFLGWGTTGQMLKLEPYSSVDIRRISNNIFIPVSLSVPPSSDAPGAIPLVTVSTPGTYTLPANGGGKNYRNASGGSVTWDMTSMDLNAQYYVSNDDLQSSTISPGVAPGVIIGLLNGVTADIGPGVRVPVTRISANVYMIDKGSAGLINTTGFTVAALPYVHFTGMTIMATNGRKPGEGAGAGTGVLAYWDGAAWRSVCDGTTVAA